MASIVEQAQAFLESAKGLATEALRAAVKALPKEVQEAYWRLRKASYFIPENADLTRRREHLSDSGKYKLVVTPFATSPGSWNYAQGLVYQVGSDTPIAEVQRNYSSFPFLFVEDHPNGHSYLLCGEDYQGQTVIELDTGKRRDFVPKEAAQGHGFCWGEIRFDAHTKLLAVCGCIWAGPYEFQFYDFSDPMTGWPVLENEECAYEDPRWPTFEADGTIKCYQSESAPDDDDDDEEEAPKPLQPIASIQTFRRDGNKLIRAEEWTSESEAARRVRRAESERKYAEWKANFQASDPLYLTYAERVTNPALSPDSYESVGITYESWCPDFKLEEKRWCRRLLNRQRGGALTIDLEWAVLTGPIKVIVYKDGKHSETKFFGHSVEGMKEAFAYAHAMIGASK